MGELLQFLFGPAPFRADPVQLTWLTVGPEGGWTEEELNQFTKAEIQPVQMGSTILRSSTAAVAGAVELVRWRDGLISS